MKINYIKIENLNQYPNNANIHSAEKISALAKWIRLAGWTNPILFDSSEKNTIIAGHRRRLAALEIYASGQTIYHAPGAPKGKAIPADHVPVIDCAGWDEAKRRAYILWDNAGTEAPIYDDSLRAIELSDLIGLSFDINLIGINAEDMARLMAGDTDEKPKKADHQDTIKRSGAVKVVIALKDIGVVEQALAATGLMSRAESLLTICQAYTDDRKKG